MEFHRLHRGRRGQDGTPDSTYLDPPTIGVSNGIMDILPHTTYIGFQTGHPDWRVLVQDIPRHSMYAIYAYIGVVDWGSM